MAPRLEREQLRQFVAEYIKSGGNATAAYRKTHPRCKSAKAAKAGGTRLLSNSSIRRMLDKRVAKHEITVDRVVQEAAGVAYFKPKEAPKHSDKARMLEFLGKVTGATRDQPPPPQFSLDLAVLGKMSTEELERALQHATAVQEILAGKPAGNQ